jgi:hypothetical protein
MNCRGTMRFGSKFCIVLALLLSEAVVANRDVRFVTTSSRTTVTVPMSPKESIRNRSGVKNPKQIQLSDGNFVRGGSPSNGLPNALAGAVFFAAIEKAVKIGLKAANVQYPAQLGACIALFAFMCLTDVVAPSVASQLFASLSPGASLLAKWFPIFFIPGLVLLPLSPPIGGSIDVCINSVV